MLGRPRIGARKANSRKSRPVETWQSKSDRRTKRSDCRVVVSAKLKWLTVGGGLVGRPWEAMSGLWTGRKGGPWVINTMYTGNQEGREGISEFS